MNFEAFFLNFLVLQGVIFIHELGHFTMAYFCKIKVTSLCLGLGPKLFTKTWGNSQFALALIPLGGYCEVVDDRNFPKKTLAVTLGGIYFNLIFALIMMALGFKTIAFYSLALAILNLLPLPFFDGFRILNIFR